jgi:hypothetical protein
MSLEGPAKIFFVMRIKEWLIAKACNDEQSLGTRGTIKSDYTVDTQGMHNVDLGGARCPVTPVEPDYILVESKLPLGPSWLETIMSILATPSGA